MLRGPQKSKVYYIANTVLLISENCIVSIWDMDGEAREKNKVERGPRVKKKVEKHWSRL